MENKARTWKHWLVFLVTCGMAGSALGINMNVIGVFYQPVAQDLNMLVGTFSLHSTLAAISLSVVAMFVPKFLDRISLKPMLLIGITVAALATMGMAFTSQVWVFYILGIIRGLGSGLLAPVTLTIVINNWFEEKNSLILSFAMSVAGIVGMIMSPIFTWTISSFGWRPSFIIMGVFLAIFNLPALLVNFKLRPEDEGLLPYGAKERAVTEEVSGQNIDSKAFNKVSYVGIAFITLIIMALFHTYSGGIVQNLPGFAGSVGFNATLGASMLSAAMFGNIVFKLGLGVAGEKIGVLSNTVISLTLTLISLIVLIFARNPYVLLIFSFFLGSSYYIPGIGLPLLTNHFYGKQLANRVYPTISFVAGTGGALSMSIVGFIYDFSGSFLPALWASVVFTILCAILLFTAARKNKEAA